MLKAVRPSEMEVNIELKTGIYWYPQIEELVLHAVRKERMEDRVIYSSFNHYSIQKLKELDAKAQTAYLFGDVILDVEKGVDAIITDYPNLAVQARAEALNYTE